MHLYYDFQILILQKYGGISRYFYEIVSRLCELENIKITIPIYDNLNYYFGTYLGKVPRHSFQRKGVWKINTLNTRMHILNDQKCIFHPTYYDPYYLSWYKGKLVITIHDMAPERYYDFFRDDELISNKRKNIEAADRIIAVSESTKKDILDLYQNIDESKISVIHHGKKETATRITEEENNCFKKKYENMKEYILYVGQRAGYKNFDQFIIAIKEIIYKKKIHLICAGGGPFSDNEKSIISSVSDYVYQDNVSDMELSWLYRNAKCFVYPSKIEGFGIPIIEAQQNGCPVLLSDIPVFREIADESACFFDPDRPEDISNKLSMMIDMGDEDRNDYIKRGKKNIDRYDWKTCAQKHKDVYTDLYNDF